MNHSDYRQPARSLVKNESRAMSERSDIPRSTFLGSWTHDTTFNAGRLIPFLADEILPGDMMKYDVSAFVRMQTPLFPIFSNQQVSTFFFFVPNRLLWVNWQAFCGEQNAPTDSTVFTVPQRITANGGFTFGSLGDYFGLPGTGQIGASNTISVNALPFRAYALIWNEWFRDQNLQTKLFFSNTNGPDGPTEVFPSNRNKIHDYFTSALPWPQKITQPQVPVQGRLPVQGFGVPAAAAFQSSSGNMLQPGGIQGTFNRFTPASASTWVVQGETLNSVEYPALYVDLVNASGIALTTLRTAMMLQALYEKDARGGTRYAEITRQHFGVISPDARLQRPEYIGGGNSPVNVTPVAQTAPSAGVAVGSLGAAGTSFGQHRASVAATEHGWVIGLINVQSEVAYQQGIPREFSRRTRFDYYWPSLALLGEQAILNKEIWADGQPPLNTGDDGVWGYQERWHEYRSRYSFITGRFRSTAATPLDGWHLAQRFTTRTSAALNGAFMLDSPPMARVLAAGTIPGAQEAEFLANIMIRRTATRAMPMFSTPATLGRF